MPAEPDPPQFSVVIPCWDEEANIRPLAERLRTTLERLGAGEWEVLFIDNGSTDGSLRLMEALHEEDPRFCFLSLSRNFGHSGAVCAGLDHARGEHVVLMDGDQQDPPEMIPAFWEKMQAQDQDVVYGVRQKREKESFLRRLAMRVFYRIWRRTAYIHVPLDAGNFCLMRRRVVSALNAMRERGRFVPGLRAFAGFRQAGIEFDRPARGGGEPKTSFMILSGIALEGLLAFSVFPLRVILIVGLVAATLSLAGGGGILLLRLLAELGLGSKPAMPLGQIFLVLLAGLNLFALGVIGEYLGRVYQEVKQRPIYVVRKEAL